MGRTPGFVSGDDDRRRRARDSPSGVLWELSSAFGRIALGILCLLLLLMVLRYNRAIRKRLADTMPAPIAAFFREEGNSRVKAKPGERPGVVDKVFNALESEPPAPRTTFTMGSSEQQVLAAQGSPTRRTETTWHYGQSEVYFSAGRVVGWRNSESNPLRVR